MVRPRLQWSLAVATGAAVTALVLIPSLDAQAQPTFVVNTTADPAGGSCAGGTGSLRQCLGAASTVPGSLVTFSVDGVFTLTEGQLSATGQFTLQGHGPAKTVIDGNQADRVLFIDSNGDISISGVTIRNGRLSSSSGAQGGGILAIGDLTLAGSTITGNTVVGLPHFGTKGVESVEADGAGIFSVNGLSVTGTTISGNSAIALDSTPGAASSAHGGGLFALGDATAVSLANSTISGNSLSISPGPPATSRAEGGGIFAALNAGSGHGQATNLTITGNSAATVGSGVGDSAGFAFTNTIVAGNTGASECRGPHVPGGGHNLDDDHSCFTTSTDLHADPLLGPLADNGGPTMTHALLAGSPAIDAVGVGCPPPATDQRGIARPQGPTCDIGAFEADTTVPRPTTTTSAPTTTTTSPPTTTTTVAPTTTSTSTTTSTAAPLTTTTTAAPTITCEVTALIAGPPKQQQVTVEASAGLASITDIQIVNGTVSVAPFTGATIAPVVITATKADQTQRTIWQFVAHDTLGNSQLCA